MKENTCNARRRRSGRPGRQPAALGAGQDGTHPAGWRGEITAAELKAVEDAEIAKLVARQESIGLQAVTDGEFRRSWVHYDFLSHLDGVELVSVAQGLQFKGTQTKAEGLHVHGKIDFSSDHPMIEHFTYLESVACELAGQAGAEDDHPVADGTALSRRPAGHRAVRLSRHGAVLRRSRPRLRQGGAGLWRGRLQLPATDEVYVAYLCDEAQRDYLRGPRRRSRAAAAGLCRPGECGVRRPHARHDDLHASLPRQLPLDLDGAGRLRAGADVLFNQMGVDALLHGIRHRSCRRLRAAALPAPRASRSCWAS